MLRFIQNKKGNVATIFGFMVFPIVVAIGAGVEFGNIANMRRIIQDAADAGAIAGANKLNLLGQGANIAGVESTANSTALFELSDKPHLSGVSFVTIVDQQTGTVTVKGQATVISMFNVMPETSLDLKVTSIAETLNKVPLCVLHIEKGSSGDDDKVFNVRDTASLTAGGCLVHSNKAIKVDKNAMAMASRIQAVGKIVGTTKPGGQSGALPIDDPFAKLVIKIDKSCPDGYEDFERNDATAKTFKLSPGVHCGDIRVRGNGVLHLEPGEHYFLGDVSFKGNARLQGEDVTLIFGKKTPKNESDEEEEEGEEDYDEDAEEDANRIVFGQNTSVDLKASKSGPYAGFLIITDRDVTKGFSISSKSVDNLLGTIYVPNAPLRVQTNGDVAEKSAWSVIVAQSINITKTSKLIINKNYAGSGVPVPAGVGNSSGKPRLIN